MARQKPPPIAGPLIALITGWCMSRMALITSIEYFHRTSGNTGYRKAIEDIQPTWLKVSPAQNLVLAPVTTTTRVSLSKLTSSSASLNGTMTSKAMAFMRRAGSG